MSAGWLAQHGLELVREVKTADADGRSLLHVKDAGLGLHYALKRIPAVGRAAQQAVAREVGALNRLPFAVAPHCHRFWFCADHACLLLDWVEGRALGELFAGEAGDVADGRRRLQAALLLAEALERVHRERLLHRDVKPSNALAVMPDQRAVRAVHLVDFGLSSQQRLYDEGTAGFAAPEQFANRTLRLGEAVDVFGLAQTTWALLTGAPHALAPNAEWTAWQPAPRPRVPAYVPRELLALLEKATRFDPHDRLARVQDFAAGLRRCIPR